MSEPLKRAPQSVIDQAIARLDHWTDGILAADLMKDLRYVSGVLRNLSAVSAPSPSDAAGAGEVERAAELLRSWCGGWQNGIGEATRAVLASRETLVDAVEAAKALAVCCMATDCYSREEIEDMARATKPTFDAALTPGKGGR